MSITAEKVAPNLLIALDIDQTLAGRLIQVHLKEYWRLLQSDAPEIFWQLDSGEKRCADGRLLVFVDFMTRSKMRRIIAHHTKQLLEQQGKSP